MGIQRHPPVCTYRPLTGVGACLRTCKCKQEGTNRPLTAALVCAQQTPPSCLHLQAANRPLTAFKGDWRISMRLAIYFRGAHSRKKEKSELFTFVNEFFQGALLHDDEKTLCFNFNGTIAVELYHFF